MTAPRPGPLAQPAGPSAPPADDPIVRQVAEVLLAAYAIGVAADAIMALLRPWRVTRPAVLAALGLASHATRPRPALARNGIDPRAPEAAIARKAAADDAYYRAAFVVNCSTRISARLDDGESLHDALGDERRYYGQHRAARDNRLDTAADVANNAALFGPVLGWYRNHASDSEAECIAADGCNFRADTPPMIGYPGAVHPRCQCKSGPPHATKVTVDDAVRRLSGTVRPGRAAVRVAARKAG